MSIFGSILLVSCSSKEELDIHDNIKSYNYTVYSELANSNSVKFDLESIIKACNQRYIDSYMAKNEDVCDDVKGYLKFRDVYDNVDIEYKDISLDANLFNEFEEEYIDTSSISYFITFTAYTDLDILDCMAVLEYDSKGNLVHFDCLGI